MSNVTKYSIQLNHTKDVGTVTPLLQTQGQVHALKNKEPVPISALPNTRWDDAYKIRKVRDF